MKKERCDGKDPNRFPSIQLKLLHLMQRVSEGNLLPLGSGRIQREELWGWFAGGAAGTVFLPWKGFAPVPEAPFAPSLEHSCSVGSTNFIGFVANEELLGSLKLSFVLWSEHAIPSSSLNTPLP